MAVFKFMGKKRRNKKASSTPKTYPKPVIKKKSKTPVYIVGGVVIVILLITIFGASTKADYPEIQTARPVLGSEDAPVLIEEFSDLQCPACRQAHPLVKQLLDEYEGQVKLQYYHFPLVNLHPQAFQAHVAAECANDQGILPEFVDKVYENQANLRKNDLVSYAEELGADETFAACLNSGTKDAIVRADMDEGFERNVRGTPTFFINGQAVQTNLVTMRAIIEQEIANS